MKICRSCLSELAPEIRFIFANYDYCEKCHQTFMKTMAVPDDTGKPTRNPIAIANKEKKELEDWQKKQRKQADRGYW